MGSMSNDHVMAKLVSRKFSCRIYFWRYEVDKPFRNQHIYEASHEYLRARKVLGYLDVGRWTLHGIIVLRPYIGI